MTKAWRKAISALLTFAMFTSLFIGIPTTASAAGPTYATDLPASELADRLFNSSAVATDASVLSASGVLQYGSFSNADGTLPFSNGIVLSTGSVGSTNDRSADNVIRTIGKDYASYSTSTDPSEINERAFAELYKVYLANGGATSVDIKDAAILSFKVTIPQSNSAISFDYFFASNEYDQNPKYNDTLCLWVVSIDLSTWTNIAKLPNDNSVNIANTRTDILGLQDGPYYKHLDYTPINYLGRTIDLSAEATGLLQGKSYYVVLAVADTSDFQKNSAIFIRGKSFNFSIGKPTLISQDDPTMQAVLQCKHAGTLYASKTPTITSTSDPNIISSITKAYPTAGSDTSLNFSGQSFGTYYVYFVDSFGNISAPCPVTFKSPGYTVTCYDFDGTTVIDSGTYDKLENLPSPTRIEYYFSGWYKDLAYTTPITDGETITAPMNLYAKWTPLIYTISAKTFYSTNSGSSFKEGTTGGTVTGENSYEFNSIATLAATPATGYDFVGWYNSDGAELTENPVYSFPVTQSETNYARFTQKTQQITLNITGSGTISANGTTNGAAVSNRPAGTYNFDYGTDMTLTATESAGYTFSGWLKNATTFISSYKSLNISITESASYTAVFHKDSTIDFHLNGGAIASGNSLDSFTLSFGNTVTLPKASAVYKSGYTFGGWQIISEDGVAVTGGAILPSEQIVYYSGGTPNIEEKSVIMMAVWTPAAAATNYETPNGWKYSTIEDMATDAITNGYASLMGLTMTGFSGSYTLTSGAITVTGDASLDANLTLNNGTGLNIGSNLGLTIPSGKTLEVKSGATVNGSGVNGTDIYTDGGTDRLKLFSGSHVDLSDGGHLLLAGNVSNCFVRNRATTNDATTGLTIDGSTVSLYYPIELRAESKIELPSAHFLSAPGYFNYVYFGLVLKADDGSYHAIQTLSGEEWLYSEDSSILDDPGENTTIPNLTGWSVATADSADICKDLFGRLNVTNQYVTLGKDGVNKLGAINNTGVRAVIKPRDSAEPNFTYNYTQISTAIADTADGSTIYLVRSAYVGNANPNISDNLTFDRNLTLDSGARTVEGDFATVVRVNPAGDAPRILTGVITIQADKVLSLKNIKLTGTVNLESGSILDVTQKTWYSGECVTLNPSSLSNGARLAYCGSKNDAGLLIGKFKLTNALTTAGYYLSTSSDGYIVVMKTLTGDVTIHYDYKNGDYSATSGFNTVIPLESRTRTADVTLLQSIDGGSTYTPALLSSTNFIVPVLDGTHSGNTNNYMATSKYSFANLPYDDGNGHPYTYSVDVSATNYQDAKYSTKLEYTGRCATLYYSPNCFDATWAIDASSIKSSVRPVSANCKIVYYTSTGTPTNCDPSSSNWAPISQHQSSSVSIKIDQTTGKGLSAYSVWKADDANVPYYYQIKVLSYVMSDGKVIDAANAQFGTTYGSTPYNYSSISPMSATVSQNTFSLTFDADGHGVAPSAQDVIKNQTAQIPTAPSETGWSFDGWWTSSDSSGKKWSFSADAVTNLICTLDA